MSFNRVKDTRPRYALKPTCACCKAVLVAVVSVFSSATLLVVPLCHMMFQGQRVDICSSSPTANLQKHQGDSAQHRRREFLGIHLVFANQTSGINNTSAGVRSSAQLGRLTPSDSTLSGQRDGGLHQSSDRSSRRHTCLCGAHLCHGHHRWHVSMQRLPLIPLSRFFQAPTFFHFR